MTEFDHDTATSFEVLGQEVRISILEALVQQRVEEPQNPGLSFSELRNRVDIADSGRFNYHLDKLAGRFVQNIDDGYELNAAGQEVAGAILSGSFDTDSSWGPTELETSCQQCGTQVAVHYSDGMIVVECDDGHLNHRDYFPRSLVERVSLPEAMKLATLIGKQELELLVRDVCPKCYGEINSEIKLSDGQPILESQCDQCGHFLQGPASLVVLTHPVLQSAYLERDRDIREAPLWTLPFLTNPERFNVESETPLRVMIDASPDELDLTFLVDEDCSVIKYTVEHPDTKSK